MSIMNKDMSRQVYMNVDIVLGNPKIKCDGYGICKFITKSNALKRYCMNFNQLTTAKIRFENGALCLHFDKTAINPMVFEKYFADDLFRVDCDVEIPEGITQFFKIPPSVLIKGIYQINTVENDMSIRIAIREVQHFVFQSLNIAA
jgi:hypothetical protein